MQANFMKILRIFNVLCPFQAFETLTLPPLFFLKPSRFIEALYYLGSRVLLEYLSLYNYYH